MKILVNNPNAIPCPPPDYGGLELITAGFAINAAQKGHEVTMTSAQGSALAGDMHFKDGGKLSVVETVPPNWNDEREHYLMIKDALEKKFGNGEGIIWDNTWVMEAYESAARLPNMKIVHTHHGNLGFSTPPPGVTFPRFLGLSREHAQMMNRRLGVPVRYVWNGIVMPPREEMTGRENKGYLLSLNRISKFKGIHVALDLAMQTRTPMIIVGDDTKVEDQSYVGNIVNRCRKSAGLIKYYGLVDSYTKNELIKGCKAMIACPIERNPVDNSYYQEAFGLNVVEANAYGKPALCLANGGHKDTVEHGVNGYLAEDPDKLRFYIEKLDLIKPEDCRRIVEEKFTVDKMTDSYLSIFKHILDFDPAFQW